MYDHLLYKNINDILISQTDTAGDDNTFYTRFLANASNISSLYNELYRDHPKSGAAFGKLIQTILNGYKQRPPALKERDKVKDEEAHWFLSNQLAGMSLYVDRFCGNISNLASRLDYFETLGVNLLHLMPLFESPVNESDGGYAVSNFRKIDDRFGTLGDLQRVQDLMRQKNMYLMMDIVLNHTSRHQEWAKKAREGDPDYQEYFISLMIAGCRMNTTERCPISFRSPRRVILPMLRNAGNGS